MKEKRHAKILELIRNNEIETQDELCRMLNEEGYRVTQATVSRDIRDLQLTKVAFDGTRQKYTLFSEQKNLLKDKFSRIFREGTVSIATAQNILVIKTVSGMAMAVAAALDSMNFQEIVGSIAGDDTIMCAVSSAEDAQKVMARLRKVVRDTV